MILWIIIYNAWKMIMNLSSHDEAIKYTRDDNLYTNYFKIIDTFDKFLEVHCISNYKIIKNTQEIYKNRDKEKCKKLIENIYSSMEERAEIISKKYTNELYQYFSRLGIDIINKKACADYNFL